VVCPAHPAEEAPDFSAWDEAHQNSFAVSFFILFIYYFSFFRNSFSVFATYCNTDHMNEFFMDKDRFFISRMTTIIFKT